MVNKGTMLIQDLVHCCSLHAGPAAAWPVPRALHTLTQMGCRFVLVGGSGPLGPLGDVHLLQDPAVQRGVQLQQRLLSSQQLTTAMQLKCADLQAHVQCSKLQVEQLQQRLEVGVTHPRMHQRRKALLYVPHTLCSPQSVPYDCIQQPEEGDTIVDIQSL